MQAISAGELDMTCLAAASVVGELRRRIEYRLAAWKMAGLVYDTCLVVTELIANARRATPDGEIRIRLARLQGGVLVEAWDASDQTPVPRPIRVLEPEDLDLAPEHFDDNGGWGLPLVQALAAECGTRRTVPNGKWVWARLAVRA